ncbi:ABC transporter substrate-binding protein [Xylophilus sp.]|uniref:ABC transporter substrate-binding protein n=1 Tax=Xylophilus sp. TaxID=2653893 RepID=UPI0013B6D16F|nr:ABC transporter substrate-binding protein [Xylophilus sp.]KAF1047151.1 MAG: putative aliphatic sulfonates-binding protein [Xylophilus sp.]
MTYLSRSSNFFSARRRTVLALAAGSAAGLAAAGPDLSQVTLTVGTPNKTGLHRQLLASGEAEGAPYKIRWADFDSTPPLIEALRAGYVDISAGGETGLFFGIANGVKASILAATVERGESGSAILVRKDSPLKTVADLRGRKIALPYFTKQHYQLARALEQAGVPWDEKLILRLNTTDGLSALVNGQVEAFVVWDPNAAIAETQHGARVLQPLKAVVDAPGVLYAPDSSLQDPVRKAALADLVRRIIRAQAWVLAHPKEWSEQVARLSQISIEAARLSTSRSSQAYAPADDPATLAAWQQQIDFFAAGGQFRKPFKVADHVARDFSPIVPQESASVAQSAR